MKYMPHNQVYAKLARSPIHGVGVFAIRPIKKGTYPFRHDHEPMVWVDETDLRGLRREVRRLYTDFGVLRNNRYGCPTSFNMLTPAWYVNHSRTPNLAIDQDYCFYTVRDIRVREELTADYSTYSDTRASRRRTGQRVHKAKRAGRSSTT